MTDLVMLNDTYNVGIITLCYEKNISIIGRTQLVITITYRFSRRSLTPILRYRIRRAYKTIL